TPSRNPQPGRPRPETAGLAGDTTRVQGGPGSTQTAQCRLGALGRLVFVWRLRVSYLTRGGVEDERAELRPGVEVEHATGGVQAPSDLVERPAADLLAVQPVVLDETDHRGLVGRVVADVVVPRPRRDHQQRQPRPVT